MSGLRALFFSHHLILPCNYKCACLVVSYVRLFVTPGTVLCQAPLYMGFSKKTEKGGIFQKEGMAYTTVQTGKRT